MSGEELRAIRHRLGLSQAQFAARLGVLQGHIADMELDRRPIRPEFAEKVRALVTVPPGLCGTCLCVIAGGMCGCQEAA